MMMKFKKGCLVTHKDAPGEIFTFRSYGMDYNSIVRKAAYVEGYGNLGKSQVRPSYMMVLTANLSIASLAAILRAER